MEGVLWSYTAAVGVQGMEEAASTHPDVRPGHRPHGSGAGPSQPPDTTVAVGSVPDSRFSPGSPSPTPVRHQARCRPSPWG